MAARVDNAGPPLVSSAGVAAGGPAGVRPTPELADEIAAADAAYEAGSPQAVIGWAFERFGAGAVLTSSFQDCVLVDLALQVRRPLTVVFLDTGFHFAETLAYLDQVRAQLGVVVEVVDAGLGPDELPCGAEGCCQRRKVEPLERLLEGKTAWLTGVKRVDTPERAEAATVSWDARKGVVKVNPIVSWTESDVEAYVASRGLPRHPLNSLGYRSIGCAPTTRPVAPGADPRAGRFSGGRTECGLHL